jgi:hypothetical protein
MNDELTLRVERLVREAVSEFLNSGHAIPISVSARHMHITQEHLEQLFGPGTQLSKMKDLLQPGEFAAEQTVTVVGPNRHLFEKVIWDLNSPPAIPAISKGRHRSSSSAPKASYTCRKELSGRSGTSI